MIDVRMCGCADMQMCGWGGIFTKFLKLRKSGIVQYTNAFDEFVYNLHLCRIQENRNR